MMLKFHFPQQLAGEKIILLLRPHWFIILKRLIFWGILALLPFIFYLIFKTNYSLDLFSSRFYSLLVLFISIYYIYIWLFTFVSFIDYYLDVWIVTNQRIINIKQGGLFSRTVSEQKLDRVQDVTAEVKGFFPTVLNYGEIHVQTAGEEKRFVFENIPSPYNVSRKIIALAEFIKKYKEIIKE